MTKKSELTERGNGLAELDAMPAIERVTPAALAAGLGMQMTRSTFCTAVAVQKPRLMADVTRRLREEAILAGEEFYYGWGAGKDAIEGPSIELAVAAARCWGNCATEMLPVQETADAWIFTAAFIDLETGYTRTRQFRQSKGWKVHGKLDDDRKADIRFQIGQSKAERNVILKALPASLIRMAMETAREGVRAKLQAYIDKNGLVAAVDLLLRELAKVGVKEPAVLSRCGVAEKKALGVDHLVVLRGDLAAIQGGRERAEELFPVSTADKVADILAENAAKKEVHAITAEQEKRVRELIERLGLEEEGFVALCESLGVPVVNQTQEQAVKLIARLEMDLEPAQA